MSETPDPNASLTEGQRANAVAAAAASDVGSGSADTIAASCEMVRIGVFFDGTNNFRNRASDPNRSWHSNPDLLEEIYEETNGAAVWAEVQGVQRLVHFRKEYMRGIGVKRDGSSSWFGPGFGTGTEGVDARVNQAVDRVRSNIRSQMAGKRPCDIWIDTFGFSRGATAARDFANQIRDGDLDSAGHTYRQTQRGRRIASRGPTPEVKFMGLFDTVSSTGWGGETDGTWWVDLTTPGRADYIYHITAEDELRQNFPLTRAAGGRNKPMVGVHGDIGGGYHPPRNSGRFEYEARPYTGLTARLEQDWGVAVNGPAGPGGETLRSEIRTYYPPAMGMIPPPPIDVTWHIFEWQATQGLQFVALKLMHNKAVEKGVPFPETLPTSIAGKSVAMDATLESYYGALQSGADIDDSTKSMIRQTYSNFSSNNETVGGYSPFLPERDGRRRSETL
ncbi:MAG: DUF2235 domain-containing protein [Pseudomonadota bacterium]